MIVSKRAKKFDVKNRTMTLGTCLTNSEKVKKLLNQEAKKGLKEIIKIISYFF
jgi:hypothetical protein